MCKRGQEEYQLSILDGAGINGSLIRTILSSVRKILSAARSQYASPCGITLNCVAKKYIRRIEIKRTNTCINKFVGFNLLIESMESKDNNIAKIE
jgi:hypothetical protein